MRILWISDAPWLQFGYGSQTSLIVPRLIEAGHDVAILDKAGHRGAIFDWSGVRVYPFGYDEFARDMAAACCKDWRADVMITFFDIQAWAGCVGQTWLTECAPWVAYCPVDHDPPVPDMVAALDGAYHTVVYSRFGFEALEKKHVSPLSYIPHGVDREIFKPLDRAEARKRWGFPEDRFIVGFVGDNHGMPNRKGLPTALLAFKQFKDECDSDAFLWLQTLVTSQRGGIDARYLAQETLGLKPDRDYSYCGIYDRICGKHDVMDMALLYNAIDVLIVPSIGEGFGLPILEAQACGVPVITNAATAMPELTWNGYTVKPLCPVMTKFMSWQYMADVAGFADALRAIREWTSDEREQMRARGLAMAAEYDINKIVAEAWLPFLAEREAELC